MRARAYTCVRSFVDTAPEETDGGYGSAARQTLGRALMQTTQRLLRVHEHQLQDEVNWIAVASKCRGLHAVTWSTTSERGNYSRCHSTSTYIWCCAERLRDAGCQLKAAGKQRRPAGTPVADTHHHAGCQCWSAPGVLSPAAAALRRCQLLCAVGSACQHRPAWPGLRIASRFLWKTCKPAHGALLGLWVSVWYSPMIMTRQ